MHHYSLLYITPNPVAILRGGYSLTQYLYNCAFSVGDVNGPAIIAAG